MATPLRKCLQHQPYRSQPAVAWWPYRTLQFSLNINKATSAFFISFKHYSLQPPSTWTLEVERAVLTKFFTWIYNEKWKKCKCCHARWLHMSGERPRGYKFKNQWQDECRFFFFNEHWPFRTRTPTRRILYFDTERGDPSIIYAIIVT